LQEIAYSEVAAVLHLPTGSVFPSEQSFKELGLDSVMAVEVRNRLSALLQTRLPATLLFDYPTVTELASFLLNHCLPNTPLPPPAQKPMRRPSPGEIEHMRHILAMMPVAELENAGILDTMLELAARHQSQIKQHRPEEESLSELDNDALVAMVLGTEDGEK
jgi:acyl carrier protein